MRSVSERERREADLFLADLMGGPRRRRTQAPHPLETSDESLIEDAIDPARVFDEVVYRGADPATLLLRSTVSGEDREQLPFDLAVYAGGHEPDVEQLGRWAALGERLVATVGDAYAARGLGTATREGSQAADQAAERARARMLTVV